MNDIIQFPGHRGDCNKNSSSHEVNKWNVTEIRETIKLMVDEFGVGLKTIADQVGISATSVHKALAGNADHFVLRINLACTEEWFSRQVSKKRLRTITNEDIYNARRDLFVLNEKFKYDNTETDRERYKSFAYDLMWTARGHYLSEIAGCDNLIDRVEEDWDVDHVYSVSSGYLNRRDIWKLSSPVNLKVIESAINRSKGSASHGSWDEIEKMYLNFTDKYPRWELLCAYRFRNQPWCCLGKVDNRPPPPTSEDERRLNAHYYRSSLTKRTYKEARDYLRKIRGG